MNRKKANTTKITSKNDDRDLPNDLNPGGKKIMGIQDVQSKFTVTVEDESGNI